MIRNIDGTERLYLSKGDQSIYIDNCKIPQHHIDGIRFLYTQYNKKNSGVIINDASGYGRTQQIVLFIKAVRHLLSKPVLVLCHEGAEHDWMEQFQTWMDLCDDVVLETENPFIKKLVVINTMSNLGAFSRQQWSVLVMDGDKSAQQFLKWPYTAEYKIWVTPVNVRENLDKFSQIYKWFYQNEKKKKPFDKKDFTPDRNNPSDVVDKAVRLDAFMEDIVAKNEEPATSRHYNQEEDSPPKRISRKNKDATGTKIKRSKRKIYDDEDDAPLSRAKKDPTDVPAQSSESKTTRSDYETALTNNDTDDFSTDNFKRKSIEEFNEDLLGDEAEGNTLNSQDNLNLFYEPDLSTENNSDRLYEMDTIEFSNDASNDQSRNINEITGNTPNKKFKPDKKMKKKYSYDDDEMPNELDFESKNDAQEKISSKSPVDTSKDEKGKIVNKNIETKSGAEDGDDDRESPSVFDMIVDNNEYNAESPSVITDIQSDINELVASNECDESKSEKEKKVKENNAKDKKSIPIFDELTSDIDNIALNEVQTKSNESDVSYKSKPVTKEVVPPVTNSLKRNCVDDTMKELEEKVLKKFKGSILDSLF